MSNTHQSPLIDDLERHFEGTEPAAEELLQALNAVIAKYQLHPSVVLSLLSRFSAAYIRKAQQYYDDQNVDVEEGFYHLLNTFLGELEMKELKAEIERVKRMEVN